MNLVLDAYQLAIAASEYFYEYAMVGTLDMAYPSNAEIGFQAVLWFIKSLTTQMSRLKTSNKSFGNIAVDYPSIIVKYAHTDQKFMMIQESNEKKLHMKVQNQFYVFSVLLLYIYCYVNQDSLRRKNIWLELKTIR